MSIPPAMSDTVISVENLSKRYLIGHESAQREAYTALRDVIAREARNFVRKAADMFQGRQIVQGDETEEIWALRNVSFEVKRGEVVGIIGRNGAGKSTLLKVLSRITEPSEGRVRLRGRVGSLLEVGTGFHPELTGRENIYLNGAILGMPHAEIRRKFDEIVAFAEVEKFLDTAVKRYSSGMYVRLAFAVAAHLEPEILIVDEVLAVGDAEFQKKCLGKLRDVSGHGRTVLFVSHNMAMIGALCTRAFLLSEGRCVSDGRVETVIETYANSGNTAYSISFPANGMRPAICNVTVDREALSSGDLIVRIGFVSPHPMQGALGGILLRAPTGEPVWGSNGRFHARDGHKDAIKSGVIRCEARGLPLAPGHYLLSVWLADWYEDHDGRIDLLNICFREDRVDSRRPSVQFVGHLDWPATWSTSASDSHLVEVKSA